MPDPQVSSIRALPEEATEFARDVVPNVPRRTANLWQEERDDENGDRRQPEPFDGGRTSLTSQSVEHVFFLPFPWSLRARQLLEPNKGRIQEKQQRGWHHERQDRAIGRNRPFSAFGGEISFETSP